MCSVSEQKRFYVHIKVFVDFKQTFYAPWFTCNQLRMLIFDQLFSHIQQTNAKKSKYLHFKCNFLKTKIEMKNFIVHNMHIINIEWLFAIKIMHITENIVQNQRMRRITFFFFIQDIITKFGTLPFG